MECQLELIRWIRREDGFLHPGVEIASEPGRGYLFRVGAGHTIRSGTRIASCPISTTISILNAMNIAPFGSHGTNFPVAFMSKQPFAVVQYFFLMEQCLLGPTSWWAPYISAIPGPNAIDSMLFAEGSEDMQWLAGTNLRSAMAKQTAKWKGLYKAASNQLENLCWPNVEYYTWRLFLWAATMFGSRGFTSQVLSDTLPADQARPAGHDHPHHQELSKLFSDGFGVLCPLLDILNYKPGAQVEWQPRFSYVGLQVLQQHESGQEIYNNYGPRDNENLMLSYGFAIPSNHFDHFSVGLRVPPGSPLAQTRAWYPEKKKEADFQCYIFNPLHPRAKSATCLEASLFSFDLLDSISVLCANDRELQAMFEAKKTYVSATLASKAKGNNRNLLNTFSQLYRECEQRLVLLQNSDPTANGEVAATPQQRYAQIHRDSQMQILATAMMLCRSTFHLARMGNPIEDVSGMLSKTTFSQAVFSNFSTLVQHHPIILTQPAELVSFAELLSTLPTTQAQDEVLEILEPIRSSTPSSQRARLATLLAVLRTFRAGRGGAAPRIDGWLDRLDGWYGDVSWTTLAAAAEESVEAAAQGVQGLLMRVVDEARRCAAELGTGAEDGAREVRGLQHVGKGLRWAGLVWAWNVVGEESVQVPSGLMGRGGDGEGEGDGDGDGNGVEAEEAGSLMLYIPQ